MDARFFRQFYASLFDESGILSRYVLGACPGGEVLLIMDSIRGGTAGKGYPTRLEVYKRVGRVGLSRVEV